MTRSPLFHTSDKTKPSEEEKTLSLDETIKFIQEHFQNAGHTSRKEFTEKNSTINYNTLKGILNYPKQQNISVNKIPLIFEALGFKCKIVKTVEFIISENE